MGTMLVRTLISQASKYLNDQTNRHWSQPTLLDWLNYGESAICMMKPDAYSVTESVRLVPGTLQTIPANGIMPGRLLKNTGIDGATPGRVITEMHINVMDTDPDWHTTTADTSIKHYVRIPGSNNKYYVWPPVHASTAVYVEIVYPASPQSIVVSDWVSGAQTINLPDIYLNPLLQLMLFRACDMLSHDIPGMAQKAASALALAVQMITGKEDAEKMTKIRSMSDGPQPIPREV